MAKEPFVYTLKHKVLSVQSTTANIPNNGVTRITANSTYTLDAPVAGTMKTIYRASALSTINTVVNAGSGVSFDGAGGTQALNLQPSTVAGNNADISVTLLGESSTQWRVLSAWPGYTTSATVQGVRVST